MKFQEGCQRESEGHKKETDQSKQDKEGGYQPKKQSKEGRDQSIMQGKEGDQSHKKVRNVWLTNIF